MRVRLSRTDAIASSGFPRRTARTARTYSAQPGTTDRRVEAPMWPHRAGVPPRRRRRSQGRRPPSRSAHSRCPTGSPAPGTLRRCGRTGRGPRRRCRAACSTCPNRFSACATISMSPAPWASARARVSAVACAPEFSLRVPHRSRSDERSRFGSRRKRRQVQDLFIPPEPFGRMPADQPEEHQPPRDVGRFGRHGRAR